MQRGYLCGTVWIGIGILTTSLAADAQAQTIAVGQTLNVQGNVTMTRGKFAPRPCQGLDQLRAGDILTAGKGASAVIVLYSNGARFALSEGSRAQVRQDALKEQAGPAPRSLVALSRAFVRPMRQASQSLSPRFAGEVARPLSDPHVGPCRPWPMGAIRDSEAHLRWQGPMQPETKILRLRIQDAANKRIVEEHDMPPSTREFAVPSGLLQLAHWYDWSVTAINQQGSGQPCCGMVRLLTPDERELLEREERAAERMREADAGDPTPDLLLAQTYERLNLREEAREAYETVLRYGPHAGAEAALKRLKP